jgi:hypothetical protein
MASGEGRKSTPMALGILALLALVGAFGARLWWFTEPPPAPELLQGLGDSSAAGSQDAFVARLDARFPKGSSESALIAELLQEGFKMRKDVHPPVHEASYERGASISDRCRQSGTVRWTAEGDRLSSVNGGYSKHCEQ